MWKFLKYIPIFLKYLINVGPMVYEVTRWGIRVVREFRSGKKPPPAEVSKTDNIPIPVDEFAIEQSSPTAKADLDPG